MSAELLDRIEELEAENRHLRELLAPVATLPHAWRLTPSETRLVVALTMAPGCLPRDCVRFAVTGTEGEIRDKTLEVQISKARAKLRPYGVKILALYGIGLTMPPEGRAIVHEALAAVRAGLVS